MSSRLKGAYHGEAIRKEAKHLASDLKKSLKWFDNYKMMEKGSIEGVRTPYGLVSYYGILEAKATAGLAHGMSLTHAAPTTVFLVGVLMPGADADTLVRFPLMLQKTALALGAKDDGIIEVSNTIGTKGAVGVNLRTAKPILVTLSWPWKDESSALSKK